MLQSFLAATAVLATAALAQTTTNCNPLNVTCPKDTALGISNYTWDMSPSSNQPINFGIWNSTGSQVPSFDSNGLDFSIAQQGDSPTLVSTFYYFFGVCSVIMKASSGTGIISAVTALSDDLDEIDWEFKGGNDSYVFTNYYGKPYPGMQGVGQDIKLNFDPRADYHNYTTVWTNNTLQWLVDGNVVRTLNRDDPSTQGGLRYPQSPMTVKFGTWAGGSSSNKDTVAWAGGATDYSKGPFEMSVKQLYVSDASQGSFYEYIGNSGMSNSIKIWPGNSTVANALEIQNSHESLSQKVANLSSGAKIGIAIAAISVVAIGALTMAICCVKQRRAGRKERDIADAEFQKQEAELMAFRMANQRPGQMPGFGYNEFKGKR